MKKRKKAPRRPKSVFPDYRLTDDEKALARFLKAAFPGPRGAKIDWDTYAYRLQSLWGSEFQLVTRKVYNAWARDIQNGQLPNAPPSEGSS